MKTHSILFPAVALVLLAFSGCATRYTVRVDALSAAPDGTRLAGQAFVLGSDLADVEESELFYKEVAAQVRRVLADTGLQAADPGAVADLRIGIKAHLSEPLVETRSYSEPIYAQTRGYAHTVRIPVLSSDGKVVRYAYRQYWSPPRTEFAGYIDRDQQVTVYEKILVLSARPLLADGGLGDEVWHIRVSLRSQSTDYRSALPYLLAAARPYIGTRTDGEIEIVLKEDSPELQQYLPSNSNGR
jgi:hypothetical protein